MWFTMAAEIDSIVTIELYGVDNGLTSIRCFENNRQQKTCSNKI
jgi:hypothetical protein